MRKSRFTEEQIIAVLRQVESGQKVADVCREHGVSTQTYRRWKSKYGARLCTDETLAPRRMAARPSASRIWPLETCQRSGPPELPQAARIKSGSQRMRRSYPMCKMTP